MTTLTLTDKDTAALKADVLVLLSRTSDGDTRLVTAHGVAAETEEHINATLAAIGAKGRLNETTKLTGVPGVSAPLVVVSGTSLEDEPQASDHESIRQAVGAAIRGLKGTQHAAVAVPGPSSELAGAVAEGALFGAYAFNAYRSAPKPSSEPVAKVSVISSAARTAAAKAAAKRAEVLAETQAFARDLVNTPPNDLYPESFADKVKKRLSGTKVKVSVMEERALAKANCGGLIGVGQGSARPPRLVTLTYAPEKATRHVAIVGKGITFDSGGLCLKPATSMITMKCDMAGAAAAVAAVEALARLGTPVAVTAYLCLAENMTGSNAQRPGDVVTMHNGKTVEIINTDAEGRLVMADGLSFASEITPDVVVDIATLTGAAMMALGVRTAAVLSNNDDARERMVTAASRVGERQWAMPLAEELRPPMDSQVADFKHTGEKHGGMITAALFLREFVGDNADGEQIPWVHVDIAGPAFNSDGAHGYTPTGATGYGVRSLVSFAEANV
ncbi:leucyl aminopeptidase [Demetria terragena]|uniref:leucyl aminopeptidase n=1 Tax=Demetria terragena TaxID=63959 RepID=UPI00037F5FEE|nr:leucyl aminopeptidase [Demetria terragena]